MRLARTHLERRNGIRKICRQGKQSKTFKFYYNLFLIITRFIVNLVKTKNVYYNSPNLLFYICWKLEKFYPILRFRILSIPTNLLISHSHALYIISDVNPCNSRVSPPNRVRRRTRIVFIIAQRNVTAALSTVRRRTGSGVFLTAVPMNLSRGQSSYLYSSYWDNNLLSKLLFRAKNND